VKASAAGEGGLAGSISAAIRSGIASIRSKSTFAPAAEVWVSNSETSTPPLTIFPSARISTARGGEVSSSPIASPSSSCSSAV
jgi:hypothetical protein